MLFGSPVFVLKLCNKNGKDIFFSHKYILLNCGSSLYIDSCGFLGFIQVFLWRGTIQRPRCSRLPELAWILSLLYIRWKYSMSRMIWKAMAAPIWLQTRVLHNIFNVKLDMFIMIYFQFSVFSLCFLYVAHSISIILSFTRSKQKAKLIHFTSESTNNE